MRLRSLLVVALVGATLLPVTHATAQVEEEGVGENMEFVANVQYDDEGGGQGGSDIEFATIAGRDYALAGTLANGGMQIVDITDPEAPVKVAQYDCALSQGDIQVFTQGDRVLATYTRDGVISASAGVCVDEFPEAAGTQGTFIVDLTDPTAPTTVSFVDVPDGSHNMSVHPSGDFLYNSNSALINSTTPAIRIIDISDASNPVFVQDFATPYVPTSLGSESHDVFFNDDGTRGYSAALSVTLILDTTDPAAPVILTEIVDPSIMVVHQSDLVSFTREDGSQRDVLVITDEQNGAAAGTNCPGGGLHVYDITDEMNPVKLGVWFIDDLSGPPPGAGACTSHVLRMHPDQGLMTIAWYTQGVRVLDISGLADFEPPLAGEAEPAFGDGVGMTEIGSYVFDDSNTWSFKTNRIEADGSFFGYGNDISRGLDVYRFTGGLDVPPLEPVDLAPQGEDPQPEPTPSDRPSDDPSDDPSGDPDPDPDPSDDPDPDPTTPPGEPAGDREVRRLAGADRAATAATVSRETFAAGVPLAFVATGDDFADALAAGPAAGLAGAPILLAGGDLPSTTAAELSRLDPQRVVVLGGTARIPEAVVNQITSAAGVAAERIAGDDRFETAAEVARAFRSLQTPVVYVAAGGAFADALSGGPAAASQDGALLLVGADVPAATDAALRELAPSRIVILGGTSAVSAEVEQQLRGYGAAVERQEGAERYATSAAVSRGSFDAARTVHVASGARFPDALAGVPAAALAGGPVLLVEPDAVPSDIAAEIDRLDPDEVVVLGGEAVVSRAVESALAARGDQRSTQGTDASNGKGVMAPALDSASRDAQVTALATGGGSWVSPEQALARVADLPRARELQLYCLLPRE